MASQRDVIQSFIKYLDEAEVNIEGGTSQNNVKKAVDKVLDDAFNAVSNGRFTSMQNVIDAFLRDCMNAENEDDFLRNYCGIILDNEDTGSITGLDAGGSRVKTNSSIVPEGGEPIDLVALYKDYIANGSEGNVSDTDLTLKVESTGLFGLGSKTLKFTKRGLTLGIENYDKLVKEFDAAQGKDDDESKLAIAKINIINGLYSWWIEEALKLNEQSYGENFGFRSDKSSATVREISLEFFSDNSPQAAAVDMAAPKLLIDYVNNDGGANSLKLKINLARHAQKPLVNSDGSVPKGIGYTYLDQTLAHELTHGIMFANIRYSTYLPAIIKEGLADLTRGMNKDEDSDRVSDIIKLITNCHTVTNYVDSDLFNVMTYTNFLDDNNDYQYEAGYMLFRYFAKKLATSQYDSPIVVGLDENSTFVGNSEQGELIGGNNGVASILKGDTLTTDNNGVINSIAIANKDHVISTPNGTSQVVVKNNNGENIASIVGSANVLYDSNSSGSLRITANNSAISVNAETHDSSSIMGSIYNDSIVASGDNLCIYTGNNSSGKDVIKVNGNNVTICSSSLPYSFYLPSFHLPYSFHKYNGDLEIEIVGDKAYVISSDGNDYIKIVGNNANGNEENYTIKINGGNDTVAIQGNNNEIDASHDETQTDFDKFIFTAESKNNSIFNFEENVDELWLAVTNISAEIQESDYIKSVVIISPETSDTIVVLTGVTSGSSSNIFYLTEDGDTVSTSIDQLLEDNSTNFPTGTGGSDSFRVISGTVRDDLIRNSQSNVVINAREGKDTIENGYIDDDVTTDGGKNVVINAGEDDDFIDNVNGEAAIINCGTGHDTIFNSGSKVHMYGGEGNDSISNEGSNDVIYSENGNDSLTNFGDSVTINGGTGNDQVANYGDTIEIYGGTDNDYLLNYGNNITVDGNEGNDTIQNVGNNTTIIGNDGNDSIVNNASPLNKSIGTPENNFMSALSNGLVYSGLGDDTIAVYGVSNASIHCGRGNNVIYFPYEGYSPSNVTFINFNPQEVVFYFPEWAFFSSIYEFRAVVKDGDLILQDGLGFYTMTFKGITSTDDISDTWVKKWNGYNGSLGNIIYNSVISESDENNTLTIDIPTLSNTLESSTCTENISISGGSGNDTIRNYSDAVTISGDAGDDLIYNNGVGNVYQYAFGDGNDTIYDYNTDSIILLINEDITSSSIDGTDLILNIGSGSIRLTNSKGKNVCVKDTKGNITSKIYDYSNLLINGTAGDDTISVGNGLGVTINGLSGNDTITNLNQEAFIDGGSGNDSIQNYHGNNVTVNGNVGDDYIFNDYSDSVTIDGGIGNDTIYNYYSNNAYIDTSDGCDSILNYNSNDVTIDSGDGDDTISNDNGNEVYINANDGDDSVKNNNYNVTINGGAGNDYIDNSGSWNSIDGGSGNDYIYVSSGSMVTVEGGDDDDTIRTSTSEGVVYGGSGNDYISNSQYSSGTFIDGGSGNDTINNYYSDDVTIDSGIGNDTIYNYYGDNIVINSNNGDDTIENYCGESVYINDNDGDDYIRNYKGNYATINAIDGDNTISNQESNFVIIRGGNGDDNIGNSNGDNVTISGGDGDDYITSYAGYNTSIEGGKGNDTIHSSGLSNILIYTNGDGNDVIFNMSSSDTLVIGSGTGTYSSTTSGDDVILKVGEGLITIQGGTMLPTLRILGSFFYEPIDVENPKIITGTANADSIVNAMNKATINALTGNDSIENSGNNVCVDAGDDNDYIYNSGNQSSIYGGEGNNRIDNEGTNVSILSSSGNDSIYNGHYLYNSVGSCAVIYSGDGDDEIINYGYGTTIDGGDGNDTISNGSSMAQDINGDNGDSTLTAIYAGAGDDSIKNLSSYVTIDGGKGDDWIYNDGDNVIIDSGDGNNDIRNGGDSVQIYSGVGNDYIVNFNGSNSVTINTGNGNDSIVNKGTNTTIESGAGDDSIANENSYATINASDGNDRIWNNSDATLAVINGEKGNDEINNYGESVKVSGGDNDDSIYNNGNNVTILGDDGDDSIYNIGENVTISGGIGNDNIYNYNTLSGNVYLYDDGDGNDIIQGITANDTLIIGNGIGTYSTTKSGDNLIVNVGEGSILLEDVTSIMPVIQGSLSGGGDTIPSVNTWQINGTTATYGTTDKVLITIVGLKDGATTNDFSLEGTTLTLKKSALGTAKVELTGNGYTLALADDVSKVQDVIASWTVNNGTATYKGGKTAGYTLNGNTVTYSAAVSGQTLASISGLKSNAPVSGITMIGNTITLSASVLDQKNVTLSGDGYTLALANDVDTVKDVDATWSVTDATATYKGGKSAGYTLNGNTVTYSAAVSGETLATITGLKSNAQASGISTSGNTITLSNSILDQKEVTLTGEGYTLALANDVDKPTALPASWKVSVGTATYRGSTTAGYVVEGNKVNYQTASDDEAIMTITGLNANATDNDISLNNSILTLAASAIDTDTVKIEKTVGVSRIAAGKAGSFLIGNQTFTTETPVDFATDDNTNVISIHMANVTAGSLTNSADNISVLGGTGNDAITNSGNNATISGNLGNDTITSSGNNAVFLYTKGDGDDVIVGFTENDTLKISGDMYNTTVVGGDLHVNLVKSRNNIILKDAANITPNIEGTWSYGYEDKDGKIVENPVATIVYSGETYYYESIARATNDAENNSIVTVIADSTETAQINTTKGVTIQFAESRLGTYSVSGGNFISADSAKAAQFSINSSRVLSNSNSLLIKNGATVTIDGYNVTGTANGYRFALQDNAFTINNVAYSGTGTADFNTSENVSITSGANVIGTNSLTSDKGINIAAGNYTINGVKFSVSTSNKAFTTSNGVRFNLSTNAVTYNAMTFTGGGTATINENAQIFLTGGAVVSSVAADQVFTFNDSGTYKLNNKTIVTLSESPLTVTNTADGLIIGDKIFSVTEDEEYRINVDANENIVSVSGIDGDATITSAGGADSLLTSSAGTFTFVQDNNKIFNIVGDDSVTFGLTNEGLVERIFDVVGTVAGDFTGAVSVNGKEIGIAGDNAISVTSNVISGISSGASVNSVGNASTLQTDEVGNFTFYDSQHVTINGDDSVDFIVNSSAVTGVNNFEKGTYSFDNATQMAINSNNLQMQFTDTATFVIADSKVTSVDGINGYINNLDNATVHATGAMTVNNANVNVTSDNDFNVIVENSKTTGLENISSGANVSVANMLITTDNNGNFKVGNENYIVEDANQRVTFLTDGNGEVLEVTELEGTLKTSANSVKVNGMAFNTSNTDVSIISAGVGVSRVAGLVSGDSVSGSLETTTVVMSSDGTLTINEREYILNGDTSGIGITDNRIDGLDNNASLRVGAAGNYIVNNTNLTAKIGDTIIGTSEGAAYIYDPNNVPLDVESMTDEEITNQSGITTTYNTVETDTSKTTALLESNNLNGSMELALENTSADNSTQTADFSNSSGNKKVTLVGGDQTVKFNDEGGNVAVIDSESSGEKNIQLGNGGDLVIVKNTTAQVNIVAGSGNSTIVTAGDNVQIDMGGGATKIVPNKGKVTLNNYDPSAGAGVQINGSSDIMRSISNGNITFEDGQISFGSAIVNFGNDNPTESITVNLYNNQGKKQKVTYTHSDGGAVDASGERENLLLLGNNTGNKGGSSILMAGSGNDTAIGGAGDYFDLGAGYNRVELKSDRSDNESGATIAMTATSGKTEVNGFKSGFGDTSDKVMIDASKTSVSFKNGKLTFNLGNASLVLNFNDSSSDLIESADLIADDNFIGNSSNLDDITTIVYEQGDYQNLYDISSNLEQNANLNDVNITFAK